MSKFLCILRTESFEVNKLHHHFVSCYLEGSFVNEPKSYRNYWGKAQGPEKTQKNTSLTSQYFSLSFFLTKRIPNTRHVERNHFIVHIENWVDNSGSFSTKNSNSRKNYNLGTKSLHHFAIPCAPTMLFCQMGSETLVQTTLWGESKPQKLQICIFMYCSKEFCHRL